MSKIQTQSAFRAVLLLASATAFSGLLALPAQAQSNSAATLYQHCNYGGYAIALPAGDHNYSDLLRRGAKNDDVSAIKVAPGHKITIFRDANYKGPSKTFDKDVSCLVSHRMNDFLSSVKVTKTASASVAPAEGCANHHKGRGISQAMANKDCKAGATHSYLTGVKHTGGEFMSSHNINGRNVSAAYVRNGRFEETDQDSKTWKEFDKKGNAVFSFKETHRDEWSVYMKDESRNVRLQIDVHRKKVRYAAGNDAMSDLYDVDHFAEFH